METSNQLEIASKLNQSVASVISAEKLLGFEKAYLLANAAKDLKQLLTKEYMLPIMALQGNRLGFKTDKDKNGGYPEDIVKNCLIEAVLMGLQPCGNQFNIIAGNMYPTKEGMGYLLNNIKGLEFDIVLDLPRINETKTSAAVTAKITWTVNGLQKVKDIPIPIKMDAYTSTDAVIGKATRKARAWLYSTISGTEITDGDASEHDAAKTIPIDNKVTLEDLLGLYELKKDILSTEDKENADRIIKFQESASYQKLYNILQAK